MTPKSLFRLAIQLCGLYLIYWTIVGVPRIIAYAIILPRQIGYGSAELVIGEIIGLILHLVVGLVLLFASGKITSHFMSDDSTEPVSVAKESIIEIVIVVAGIIMIVANIPAIYPAITSSGTFLPFRSTLTEILITIAAGTVLIWKARTLSRFIMRIKAIESNDSE